MLMKKFSVYFDCLKETNKNAIYSDKTNLISTWKTVKWPSNTVHKLYILNLIICSIPNTNCIDENPFENYYGYLEVVNIPVFP